MNSISLTGMVSKMKSVAEEIQLWNRNRSAFFHFSVDWQDVFFFLDGSLDVDNFFAKKAPAVMSLLMKTNLMILGWLEIMILVVLVPPCKKMWLDEGHLDSGLRLTLSLQIRDVSFI